MLSDDKIIEMAKQAGIEFDADGSNSFVFSKDQFITFARLIEAATREECARIADKDTASCCNARVASKIREGGK